MPKFSLRLNNLKEKQNQVIKTDISELHVILGKGNTQIQGRDIEMEEFSYGDYFKTPEIVNLQRQVYGMCIMQ